MRLFVCTTLIKEAVENISCEILNYMQDVYTYIFHGQNKPNQNNNNNKTKNNKTKAKKQKNTTTNDKNKKKKNIRFMLNQTGCYRFINQLPFNSYLKNVKVQLA